MLALAFVLRVIDLNSVPGFNGDEAWYGVQIERFQASLPVAFRAPSGRLSSNVFLAAVLTPVQLVVGPAVWVLRVPAVVAGVLTVWLAFACLRGVWGRTVALSTALILAALPINIAYSRFGWDPSLLGPFLVLAIALAGRGLGVAATLTLAAAVMVHPTAVFALPMVWGLLLGVQQQPLADAQRPSTSAQRPSTEVTEVWWRSAHVRWAGVTLASTVVIVLTGILGGARQPIEPQVVVQRITDGQAWDFTVRLFSLFSGRSVYHYFVAAQEIPTGWLVLERCALVVTLMVLGAGLVGAIGRRCWRDVGLMIGTLTSLSLLYLTSGIIAVLPDGGRYAVYAIPAVVLSFVLALKHSGLLLMTGWQRRRSRSGAVELGAVELGRAEVGPPRSAPQLALGGALVLAATLLVITVIGYLQPLRNDGSTTHEAFATGRVDPRQQAWQIVSTQSGVAGATVYCESWWICYPLQYFAGYGSAAPTITPLGWGSAQLASARAADFVVVRSGSYLDRLMDARFQLEQRSPGLNPPQRWVVADLRGRPTYTVFRL